MKSFFKFVLVTILVLGLLSMAFGVLVAFNVLTQPDFSISINGSELPLQELHAGHWMLGAMGLGVAAVVVVVVVPLALLLGLAMPLLMLALGLSLGLMSLLGVGALVLSPLLLLVLALVWLLVWLPRRRKTRKPPTQ